MAQCVGVDVHLLKRMFRHIGEKFVSNEEGLINGTTKYF